MSTVTEHFKPGHRVRVTHSHRDTGTVLSEDDQQAITARRGYQVAGPTVPVAFDDSCDKWSPGEVALIRPRYLEAAS